MNNNPIELKPAGADLFAGFETFMRDLSEHDESIISGGAARSRSKSNDRRRRRRVRRRRRPNRSRT